MRDLCTLPGSLQLYPQIVAVATAATGLELRLFPRVTRYRLAHSLWLPATQKFRGLGAGRSLRPAGTARPSRALPGPGAGRAGEPRMEAKARAGTDRKTNTQKRNLPDNGNTGTPTPMETRYKTVTGGQDGSLRPGAARSGQAALLGETS